MISFMTYTVLVTLLVGASAEFGERILAELRCPRRGAWAAALIISFFLPVKAALLNQTASTSAIISIPFVLPSQFDGAAREPGSGATTLTGLPWLRWPQWSGLESLFTVLWVTSSVLTLLIFTYVWLSVRRRIRHMDIVPLEGQNVFVSDRLGPAVFGFFKPRVILPRWLLENAELRDPVLRHECAHIASRDQLVLLGALLLAAAMPWNIGLWWQVRRLRIAIEIDCDARVLRAGTDPAIYGEALLTVRRRLSSVPLGAVALGEPISKLERRIRIMTEKTRKFRIRRFLSQFALAVSLGSLAWAVNAPAQQDALEGNSRFQPVWPEFLPVVDSYAGSIAADNDGLPVLTLIYDESGARLGANYRHFPDIQHPFLTSSAKDAAAMEAFAQEMEPVTAHAAAVFESYGQPIGEPIFFRSPTNDSGALLIWASSDFVKNTMSRDEPARHVSH